MSELSVWTPVPVFPEYEMSQHGQFRRVSNGIQTRPYNNRLRPNEGQFVDFWVSGQRHAISVDVIMAIVFPRTQEGITA